MGWFISLCHEIQLLIARGEILNDRSFLHFSYLTKQCMCSHRHSNFWFQKHLRLKSCIFCFCLDSCIGCWNARIYWNFWIECSVWSLGIWIRTISDRVSNGKHRGHQSNTKPFVLKFCNVSSHPLLPQLQLSQGINVTVAFIESITWMFLCKETLDESHPTVTF